MGGEWPVVLVGERESVGCVAGDDEFVVVDEVVAPGAEADEDVEVGGTAVGPPDRVVDLQVGVATPGCGTGAVLAGDHGAALFQCGEAVGAADVQDR